jgi:sigma-B regulation protein RsbU (phosphoserine phosphatase)
MGAQAVAKSAVSPARSLKLDYAVLAILFAGAIAFQAQLSLESLQHIWISATHFRPEMLTWMDLEFFGHVLTPIACVLLAFYVTAVRISAARAWLLLAVLISFSINADGLDIHDKAMLWRTPLKHLALTYRSIAAYTFPFWLALFAIYFPTRASWEIRHPQVKWVVLAPVAIASCWMAILRIAANEIDSAWVHTARQAASSAWSVLFYISVLFFLGTLSAKLALTKLPDDRRRLRVLLFGIALTLIPLCSLSILSWVLHEREEDLPPWLLVPVFPVILSFPLTIAYVTVVQRALDLGVVIRESLQYALARRGVLVLQILISIAVVLVVADLAGQMSLLERALVTGLGIGAVLFVGMAANRIGSWIDRRFFREAHDAEQILNRLAESVSSIVELGPLLKIVSTRIADALHISEIAVYLRDTNGYRPAFAVGSGSASEIAFDDQDATVSQLRRSNEPLPVYFENRDSWVSALPKTEIGILRQLEARLLLPLARKNELLGFISLGPKYAEAPYSRGDLNLLHAVATQTALAVENSQLASAIAAETAEREVIQRELAIAREVQQRLFPQNYPQVPGVEYYGTCRPAREVGGDYYDFLELPDNALGLAVGDVSGKGVSASLLMASLQASLRAQALVASADIKLVMENVNRLVYAATPINRYATFFYAQYDPVSHELEYVNAGHNPPIVLRSDKGASQCIRLETGGPPVGLLPQAVYACGCIDLSPQDLLVLFTDGISESMNPADEEWGERGLLETLTESSERGPSAIAEAIFAAADAFAAGAPQHDDMTLVVLRVLN